MPRVAILLAVMALTYSILGLLAFEGSTATLAQLLAATFLASALGCIAHRRWRASTAQASAIRRRVAPRTTQDMRRGLADRVRTLGRRRGHVRSLHVDPRRDRGQPPMNPAPPPDR